MMSRLKFTAVHAATLALTATLMTATPVSADTETETLARVANAAAPDNPRVAVPAPSGPTDLVVTTGAAQLVLPRDPTAPIELTRTGAGARLEISMPSRGAHEEAEIASDGTVVYAGPEGAGDLVVQALGEDTVRIHTTIDSPDAAMRFTYSFGANADQIVPADDGSTYIIDANGQRIGVVAAPWAFDALGAPSPPTTRSLELG